MQVDLLYPTPTQRLDPQDLSEALTFAFATGGGSETFERILDRARFEGKSFDPECFADDLFLDSLIQRCLNARGPHRAIEPRRGYLKGALNSATADEAIIRHRQRIFEELTQTPELSHQLEHLHAALFDFEQQLILAETGKRRNPIARRMEILRALKRCVDLLADSFDGCRSGLAALGRFGQSVSQGDAFQNLCQLIDHDQHLATVDISVRVGRDGSLRSFAMVRSRENKTNPFYTAPGVRLLTRLFAWIKGYKLHQRELQGRLVQRAFDDLAAVVMALLQLRADVDFYLAGLALRDFAGSRGLSTCLPDFTTETEGRIDGLFNPFLLLEEDPPVATDVVLTRESITVITGPNSGGKTRLLQALGICQLLAQCGFVVPAKAADLRPVRGLFVSLVYPTTADAREGRLGTELLRIRRLFQRVENDSLILLDELCSGTNPSEGEEIFRLVVELLALLAPTAFISTHFLSFAAGLQKEGANAPLRFLQVELDERLEPTYGFVPGVARTSLAYRTAERLGVTRDALLAVIAKKR